MKPEVFERCLEEVKKHIPPLRVCSLYQGGEPFLNKHFMAMIPRVKALGFPLVKTVSNGMLIKPEMCDDIVTSGLDELEISMDGHSPEENDRVRINSRFEHLNVIVHKLVEANRRRGEKLQMVISSTQFMSLDNLKIDEPAGAPAYLRNAFADIIEDIHFKPTLARIWPSALPAEGYDLLHDDRPHVPPSHCDILDDMLNIRADGRVVACCYDLTSTTNFGNIMELSIQEIWDGLPSVSFREGYESGNFPELCQSCMVVTGPQYLLHKDGDRAPVINRVTDLERRDSPAEEW